MDPLILDAAAWLCTAFTVCVDQATRSRLAHSAEQLCCNLSIAQTLWTLKWHCYIREVTSECYTCKPIVHASCQYLSRMPGMPLQAPYPTTCTHLRHSGKDGASDAFIHHAVKAMS